MSDTNSRKVLAVQELVSTAGDIASVIAMFLAIPPVIVLLRRKRR